MKFIKKKRQVSAYDFVNDYAKTDVNFIIKIGHINAQDFGKYWRNAQSVELFIGHSEWALALFKVHLNNLNNEPNAGRDF